MSLYPGGSVWYQLNLMTWIRHGKNKYLLWITRVGIFDCEKDLMLNISTRVNIIIILLISRLFFKSFLGLYRVSCYKLLTRTFKKTRTAVENVSDKSCTVSRGAQIGCISSIVSITGSRTTFVWNILPCDSFDFREILTSNWKWDTLYWTCEWIIIESIEPR